MYACEPNPSPSSITGMDRFIHASLPPSAHRMLLERAGARGERRAAGGATMSSTQGSAERVAVSGRCGLLFRLDTAID